MMSLFRTVVFALIIIAGLYLVFGRQPAPQTLISLDDAIKNVAATIHNIEKNIHLRIGATLLSRKSASGLRSMQPQMMPETYN